MGEINIKLSFMPPTHIKLLEEEIIRLLKRYADLMLETVKETRTYEDVTGILTASFTSLILKYGDIIFQESVDENKQPDPVPPGKRSSGTVIYDLSERIDRTAALVSHRVDRGDFNLVIMTPIFYARDLEMDASAEGRVVMSGLIEEMNNFYLEEIKRDLEPIVGKYLKLAVEYNFEPRKFEGERR